jgi:Glycosyl transferase family 2
MPDSDLPVLDVSFVVNIHAGRNYLARTMQSLERAAEVAREAGLRVELMFALDRSPSSTAAWVEAYVPKAFDRTRIVAFDHGSLGLSRQAGLDLARAEYVQFCDEDDLISANTTVVCHRTALIHGPRAIVIPEYSFAFGAVHFLAHYAGTDVVSPLAFMAQHPFVSRLFVHRGIGDSVRYQDVRLSAGYAYEDWHFNATAVAAGYEFRAAPNTVIFYRHRATSLLLGMNITSTRQIPPTPLFEPATYLRACGPSFRRRQVEREAPADVDRIRSRFLHHPATREAVLDANAIDPAIDPKRIEDLPVLPNQHGDLSLGEAYYRACRLVGSLRFTDVVLAADMTPGGADGAALDLVSALARLREDNETLILLDSASAEVERPHERPANSLTIDLASLGPAVTRDQMDTISLRLIEASAAGCRLHLSDNAFARRFFRRYRSVLGSLTVVLHRSDDPIEAFADRSVRRGEAFDFLSEHLDDVHLVLADSDALAAYDRARIDRSPEKWKRLYRLAAPVQADADDGPSRRVVAIRPTGRLWQLDLARALAQLDGLSSPVTIDVVTTLPDTAGLLGYDAVLLLDPDAVGYQRLTQALAAGVAIIGPAAGAVAEAVSDGDNGLLFDPEADVPGGKAAVAAAVRKLYADGLVVSLRRRARALIESRHGRAVYDAAVADLFAQRPASFG